MSEDNVLVARDGFVATVTLNRPGRLNALTRPMWERLGECFEALSMATDIRCIVLRGRGQTFSPGNDIAEVEHEQANPEQAKAYAFVMHRALATIRDCRHPTVALIEGVCVGGGLEIAAACDLRVCAQSSRFGVPLNRLGIVMAHQGIAALMELIGRAATVELLLEGRIIDAARAREIGLVNRVVPDNEVEAEAYATARRIAEGAPLAARWHKIFVRRLTDPRPLSASELDEAYACFGTEDFEIGYRAFLAKTTPHFKGR